MLYMYTLKSACRYGTQSAISLHVHFIASYSLLYTIGSLFGLALLTTIVEVMDSVVEVVHPKCILSVLLSLMNVVVLTTTEK